jgi:aminoglycoside phosphotransferase
VADPLQFTSAFLGAGAMGRVIKVVQLNEVRPRKCNLLGLKIVKECDAHSLEGELALLRSLSKYNCSSVVVPVSDNIICSSSTEFPKLYGYLMEPVGESHVSRQYALDSVSTLSNVITALYRLHVHKPLIIHGDSRLPNLIMNKKSFFWVDLKPSVGLGIYSIANDMTVLISSIIGQDNLNENIKNMVNNYSINIDTMDMITFVSELFKELKAK